MFTHSTSREAEPQLHSHCVVMNATLLADGRWFSLSNEAVIAHQAIGGAIADSPELIRVADGKFTTQTALNLELNTIRLMQQGRGKVGAIVPIGTRLDGLTSHSLTPEQQNAVEMAATTPDAVMAWQGVAGAGKTYALSILKELA